MHTLSKLVVSAVMIRGRHRGLPVALDWAVLMPSEFLTADSMEPPPEDHREEHEKSDQHDPDLPGNVIDEVPRLLQQDRDELAARMRLRTRTISLQVAESRTGEIPEQMMRSLSLVEGVLEDGCHAPSSESESQSRAHTTLEDSART